MYQKDGLAAVSSKLPLQAVANMAQLIPLAMNLNGEDKENILNMLYCECSVCVM
jgi:hypothetical protein